ncbi:MAG: sirohydrochlorin cobaltochelatase [Syntrophobacteraceae bacterium]
MMRLFFILPALILLAMLLPSQVSSSRRAKHPARKAILLAAFGANIPEARRTYVRIDEQARKAFPGIEIRWAYTSKSIRARLAEQGEQIASIETALAVMIDEGYTHVAVLALHVIPGKEFHDLYINAGLYGKPGEGFDRILVARPLLASYEDMQRTAKALLKMVPQDLKEDEAALFMAHGNEKHPADAMIAAMNYVFQEISSKVMLASVRGRPNLDDVLPKIIERKIKKVYLLPFMVIAGEHARIDMAGDKPQSWKSVLMDHGVGCETILCGLGENPEIVEIWLDHLREAVSDL